MADTKVFPVTAEKIQKLVDELKTHSINLDPSQPHGEARTGEWDIVWDLTDTEISITVVKHPFAEEGFFWSKLSSGLA